MVAAIPIMRADLQNFNIAEDTCLKKIVAAAPFLGFILGPIFDFSLRDQINHEVYIQRFEPTFSPEKLIKLIQVKNDFKIAAIVGLLMTTILNVVFAAAGIFVKLGLAFHVGFFLLSLAVALLEISRINSNQALIDKISEDRAYPPFMEIH